MLSISSALFIISTQSDYTTAKRQPYTIMFHQTPPVDRPAQAAAFAPGLNLSYVLSVLFDEIANNTPIITIFSYCNSFSCCVLMLVTCCKGYNYILAGGRAR